MSPFLSRSGFVWSSFCWANHRCIGPALPLIPLTVLRLLNEEKIFARNYSATQNIASAPPSGSRRSRFLTLIWFGMNSVIQRSNPPALDGIPGTGVGHRRSSERPGAPVRVSLPRIGLGAAEGLEGLDQYPWSTFCALKSHESTIPGRAGEN